MQGDSMTLDELKAEAWKSLPPIRKRLAGRIACDELVVEAVRNWSSDFVAACHDETHRREYAQQLVNMMRVSHQPRSGISQQEYGFIWMFLLMAVASAVVQWLVQRWLDNNVTREQMDAWQREVAS
jgi:hypothetical protein